MLALPAYSAGGGIETTASLSSYWDETAAAVATRCICMTHQVVQQSIPELCMKLFCLTGMGAVSCAVVVQSSQCQEVDVAPDGPSPVGPIMLSVVGIVH